MPDTRWYLRRDHDMLLVTVERVDDRRGYTTWMSPASAVSFSRRPELWEIIRYLRGMVDRIDAPPPIRTYDPVETDDASPPR